MDKTRFHPGEPSNATPQGKSKVPGTGSEQTDALLKSPPSLLDICLDFVASHTHFVDSLVGFPEVVGMTLFERAEKIGAFDDYCSDITVRSLQLFSFAYGPLILENLNLEKCEDDITVILPAISSMAFDLTKLNLDFCGLGDNDELLQHISNVISLQELSIRGNKLTDTSLRILTSPMRILKRGALDLRTLDLSGNPEITDASARYLQCFQHIEAIDLSGCHYRGSGVQKLFSSLGMKQDSDMKPLSVSYPCSNLGWAAEVFNGWSKANQVQDDNNQAVHAFYGKISSSRYAPKIKQRKRSVELPPELPVIRLRRVKPSVPKVGTVSEHSKCEIQQRKRRKIMPSELLQDYDKLNKSENELRPSASIVHSEREASGVSPFLGQSIVDTYMSRKGDDSLPSGTQPEEVENTIVSQVQSSKTDVTQKKKRRKILIKRSVPGLDSAQSPKEVAYKKEGDLCTIATKHDSGRTLVIRQNKPTPASKKKPSNLFSAMNSNKW